MSDVWVNLAAGLVVIGLMAYAVLAGADFGGGVWDLFATGPRKREQREAIAHAMGPVWEANHVWLIFVIVLLFSCFPHAYVALMNRLFWPLHLALLGIMLRGASFVFRGYGRKKATLPGELFHVSVWRAVFGASSVISPLLLGAAFGAITSAEHRVDPGKPTTDIAWLSPFSIACAFLALAACAYLAAIYLCVETDGKLRDDFRTRAIIAGTATAALAIIVLLLARRDAHWFFDQLLSMRSHPIIAGGIVAFILSGAFVFGRRYKVARFFAAAEIVLMLAGWAAAQYPYALYPDLPLKTAAAPLPTVQFMVVASLAGMALLVPSLWLLFRIFKSEEALASDR
jgi:cytochrome bd ubiquinol oxidase subunit II